MRLIVGANSSILFARYRGDARAARACALAIVEAMGALARFYFAAASSLSSVRSEAAPTYEDAARPSGSITGSTF
jgi:hypothetical protein